MHLLCKFMTSPYLYNEHTVHDAFDYLKILGVVFKCYSGAHVTKPMLSLCKAGVMMVFLFEKVFLLMKKINNTIFKKEITEQCYAIIMTDPKPFVSSAGEKPFSCLHCSRAFADRSNLRAHLQTHSEMKKYQCACCLKTFSRISLLAKHQEAGCPLS